MVQQPAQEIVDCPLRNERYSADTPMMDLFANAQVVAIIEQEVPDLAKRVPPMFKQTEAPSLSAIATLNSVSGLVRYPLSQEKLQSLNDQLAGIELTDEARHNRCARYDNDRPEVTLGDGEKSILVFIKVNGFDHNEATSAATAAIQSLAGELGWNVMVTDRGGAFSPDTLKRFDVVVWNNVSGDVLTLSQRKAFQNYVQNGGGYFGIHGSGGDFIYLWDWYVQDLIGAQFIGHTMNPHYQDAVIKLEPSDTGIAQGLPLVWKLNEEWYSFSENPRKSGAKVVATIDESSYKPVMGGIDIKMGPDHPIAWSRCVGQGRAFYTGIGHLPSSYQSVNNLGLLKNALEWTAGSNLESCRKKESGH
ncbi:hypothetical protein GCM10027217_21050 [Pseudomaricurvus hydrocarbonicus]